MVRIDVSADVFASLPRCEPTSPRGALTALPVDELKPTQNAVGLDEVDAKAEKIKLMSRPQLEDYLLQRPIPVVIGNDSYYMIDHHHLARALWDVYKQDVPAPTVMVENWEPLHDEDRFWKAMARRNWVYPFDGMGAGPTKPSLLRPHVKDLDNDFYRSLAWYVRARYGYVKDPVNPVFAEFRWASFIRSRVVFWHALMKWPDPDPMRMTLRDAAKLDEAEYLEKLAYAQYLAGSPEASGLPGFIGRRC